MFKISGNPAGFEDYNVFHKLAQQFLPFAHKKLGFDKPVHVNLLSDNQNAKDPLGKTAYYDPNQMKITLFVDKRHVKDILRSMAHELIHHTQNCRGEFVGGLNTDPGYAQNDEHMRKCEGEAYLHGSGFLFRDWEDSQKKLRKENKTMKLTKDTLKQLIKEEWEDYGPPPEEETFVGPRAGETDVDVDLGALGASEAYPRGFADPLSLEDVKGKKKEAWQEMMAVAPGGDWTKLAVSSPERQNYRRWRRKLMQLKDEGGDQRPAEDPNAWLGFVDRPMELANVTPPTEDEEEMTFGQGAAPPDVVTPGGYGVPKRYAAREEEEFPVFENLEKSIFATNHYCVHHGGVQHNGQIQMAEAINHNYDLELGRVTHYDMKLEDGTILENVAAADIQVTNASLAEAHGHTMKRDDEEELEEEKKPDGDGDGVPPWADKDDDDPEVQEESLEEQEETNESWTRGNKSELLFERLIKKWIK